MHDTDHILDTSAVFDEAQWMQVIFLLSDIQHSFAFPTALLRDSLNLHQEFDTSQVIGYDQVQFSKTLITAVTDPGGRIITAFPGTLTS